MSLESLFRLSLIMNMVDNLTGPMARVQSSVGGTVSQLQSLEAGFGGMVKTGSVMMAAGSQITQAVLAPVEATFATRRAIGELASLGVKDLGAVEDAARSFSDTWAGTSKADFITAAYDIKSGIASLSDEGVAQYTTLSGLTAKATKSTIAEMTNLFATGYGIYKDFYADLTDLEFGEIFSAGIAKSVQQFKTTGSGMAQAIQTLGASATTAQVPLEEQLSVLGMLQATMSGSEAGTKYKAFLRSAAKGGKELGLNFLDANNQLLSMPEILEILRGKFGETMDAAEKMQLQKAFGDTEAVALIDLMYSKTGDLQSNILSLYDSMGQGAGAAQAMASAMNDMEPDQLTVLNQQIQNVKESMGKTLLPTIVQVMDFVSRGVTRFGEWADSHQSLVRVIMLVVLALGGFLTVGGAAIALVGGVGLVFTKTAGFVGGFIRTIKKLPDLFDTIRLYGMFAGDAIRKGFSAIRGAGATALTSIKSVALGIWNMAKTAAISAVTALKNMALGLVGMAKQAIMTAVSAMPGLIASVWSFTAALLANPITWVVVGIIALIAALVLLYNKCEWFRNGVNKVLGFLKGALGGLFSVVKGVLGVVANTVGRVLGAVKDTVSEKLGNIQRAYEEHGGGIRGIAAGAMEAVKGIFTAGFTFLDKLTGGKLSAIKNSFVEKFNGIKSTVSSVLETAKQYASEKLSGMREVYEQQGGGIRGTAAAVMFGITSVFRDGYDFIDNLTGGKLSDIRAKFDQGIQKVKDTITGAFSWFRESGKKVLTTFTEGIKSAISAPVNAVKGALQRIRNMLPFSDAKVGPLSVLTLSGHRTMTTLASGIQDAEREPAKSVERSFERVDLSVRREPIKKVQFQAQAPAEPARPASPGATGKRINIEHLEIKTDIKDMKDLNLLFKLLQEMEDLRNNTPDDELEPEGA